MRSVLRNVRSELANVRSVLRNGDFIYTQVRAYVLGEYQPILGMVSLRPFGKVADGVLVGSLKGIAIDEVVPFKRTGRYRICLQPHLLKKPPTPWSSGWTLEQSRSRS